MVMYRPTNSSVRKKVLKILAGVFMADLLAPSGCPGSDLVDHEHAEHDQPHQRHRDEHLPAQAHDLVVAIPWERGAEPQETKQEEGDLDRQPVEPWRRQPAWQRITVEERQPAAEEKDRGQ